MTQRAYYEVGDLIAASDLNDLSAAGIRTYDDAADAIADAQTTPPALRTLAVLLDTQQLVVWYYTTSGTPAWRALAPPRTSAHHKRQVLDRVPPLPVSWHRPIGAVTLADTQAAISAGTWPGRYPFLYPPHLVANDLDAAVGELDVTDLDTDSFVAPCECEVVVVAVGGGGSGAGMAFANDATIGAVTYPHTPVGGGGGGGGEVVVWRVTLRQGDTLTYDIGAGGVPADVTGSDHTTLAASQAGGDTLVYVNRQLAVVAVGGSGGRSSGEALSEQISGAQIAASYGVGSGGGGPLVPAGVSQYEISRTANVPDAWQPVNVVPPIGHRRRGGDGAQLPAGTPFTRTHISGTIADWSAWAGSGGGGIASDGTLRHGAAGGYDTTTPDTDTRPITPGWQYATTGVFVAVAGSGGGGGRALGSSRLPEQLTLDQLAGRTEQTAFGAGGGGGGVWQTTATSSSDTHHITPASAGLAGHVNVLIPRQAHTVPPITPATIHTTPRQLTNTPPSPPQIVVTPTTPTSLSDTVTLRIIVSDRDYGDAPASWQLRRSVNGGSWQYLQQDGTSAQATDVWLDTATPATVRPADPALGYLTYTYTLRPNWGSLSRTIVWQARSTDSAGATSDWAATDTFTPTQDLPPTAPVLSAIPAGADAHLTADAVNVDTGTDITFSWIHNDPDGTPQAGFQLVRRRVDGDRSTSQVGRIRSEVLVKLTSGGYGWKLLATDGVSLQAFTAAIAAGSTNGIALGIPVVGDGLPQDESQLHANYRATTNSTNWIASDQTVLPVEAGTLWHSELTDGQNVLIRCALTTITGTADTPAQSPLSNSHLYRTTGGGIHFVGLPEGAQTPFTFGAASRTYTFTVNPATTSVTAASDGLFGVALANNGSGSHTLTVTPPATDTGTYTGTVTVTGTRSGQTAEHTVTFTVTEPTTPTAPTTPTLTLTGLASHYDLTIGEALDDAFTVAPIAPETVGFVSNDTTVATALVVGTGHTRTLRLTPTGVGTAGVTVTANRTGYHPVSHHATIAVTQPAVPPTVNIIATTASVRVGSLEHLAIDITPLDGSGTFSVSYPDSGSSFINAYAGLNHNTGSYVLTVVGLAVTHLAYHDVTLTLTTSAGSASDTVAVRVTN